MRYIITQGQLHSVIYSYLDKRFENAEVEKQMNPYSNNGSYRIELRKNMYEITYIFFAAGVDDDGNLHGDIGHIYISYNLIKPLVKNLKIRETKVLDIVSDWFSEKYGVDVDYSKIDNQEGYY